MYIQNCLTVYSEKFIGSFNMLFTCDSRSISIVHSSIRSCLADILLSKGYSANKVGKLLKITGAAVSYYKKGQRGAHLKEKIMGNPRYYSMLEEIANMLIEDDGKGYLEPVIEDMICRLCRELRKSDLIKNLD